MYKLFDLPTNWDFICTRVICCLLGSSLFPSSLFTSYDKLSYTLARAYHTLYITLYTAVCSQNKRLENNIITVLNLVSYGNTNRSLRRPQTGPNISRHTIVYLHSSFPVEQYRIISPEHFNN